MPELLSTVLDRYDFVLPPNLIAQAPAAPRDAAQLLVYDRATQKTEWSVFRDIGTFLPKRSLLVLNKTKVIPARLLVTRITGGQVSLLSLGSTSEGLLRVLANRKLNVGERLCMDDEKSFTVERSHEKEWLLRPSFPFQEFSDLLEKRGTMPLPPYIKHTPLSEEELKREYQSVFAEHPGSIAAPTASLHFTEQLLEDLQKSGVTLAYVTLHVHLGTFAPLTEEQWQSGLLHEEEYVIEPESQNVIEQAHQHQQTIIAVGTTVCRALESAADASGRIVRPRGSTQLFIREGYPWKIVNGLITNFHVPRSSLLMLVSAFMQQSGCHPEPDEGAALLDLYQQAIERNFRFYSFGDAMLIL